MLERGKCISHEIDKKTKILNAKNSAHLEGAKTHKIYSKMKKRRRKKNYQSKCNVMYSMYVSVSVCECARLRLKLSKKKNKKHKEEFFFCFLWHINAFLGLVSR